MAAQAEEIARLKGLKGKPEIKPSKPSGMEKETSRRAEREWREKRRRGAKKPSAPVEERVIAGLDIPVGSRFKGYESFTVQDLKIVPQVVCYRRERWLTPEGRRSWRRCPAASAAISARSCSRFVLDAVSSGPGHGRAPGRCCCKPSASASPSGR